MLEKLIMKQKKIVFCDLDDTLIETNSGEKFPKGVWDVRLKIEVWDKIKQRFPNVTHLFVVTNQGGIEEGLVNRDDFVTKIEWILACLSEWFEMQLGRIIICEGVACSKNDSSDHFRKPNTGMLEHLLNKAFDTNPDKETMIMVGDASGKEGDFSDSDKKTAENFGIDYIDIRDL